MLYIPNTTWSWTFFCIVLVQSVIILALESYTFGIFEIDLNNSNPAAASSMVKRAIPTFLALYIFGSIYQLALTWDALRLKNTIQVFGLVLYNVGLLIYGAIQIDEVNDGIAQLAQLGYRNPAALQAQVQPSLIVIPCVLAFGTILLGAVSWKLYQEFAWTIYQDLSADLKIKRMFLDYQIYRTLLKFDFFLFLGFTIQFLVIVASQYAANDNGEFGLTIAAIPITIFFLLFAGFCVKREILAGMLITILVTLGGLAYFIFKMVRMWAPGPKEQLYVYARKDLTTFAVFTIVFLLITLFYTIKCTMNFKKGLKPLLMKSGSREDYIEKEYGSPEVGNILEMPNYKHGGLGPVVQHRMTID